MYYLKSRYYSPEWGRFINADTLGGEVGELLTHNLFAYCLNNPVNMEDASGFFAFSIGGLTPGNFLVDIRSFWKRYETDEEEKLKWDYGTRGGINEVISGYSGSSKEENIASKVIPGAVGFAQGYGKTKVAEKAAAKAIKGRLTRKIAEKAIPKIAAEAGFKGIGIIGFIPDMISFMKGFKKGIDAYYEEREIRGLLR